MPLSLETVRNMNPPRRRRRLPHDLRVQLLALGAALPALVLAGWLLASSDLAPRTRWTLGTLVVVASLAFAASAREAVARPLQTLLNLLLMRKSFACRISASLRAARSNLISIISPLLYLWVRAFFSPQSSTSAYLSR